MPPPSQPGAFLSRSVRRARSVRRGTVAATIFAAYSLGAAATRPFTWQADLLTAVPVALLALAALVRWPWHPRPRAVPAGTHPYLPWLALAAAVVAWELATYLAPGPRAFHPTLSSMADAVDHRYLLKALVFFAWLCLDAWVVSLGGPHHPRATSPGTTGA
jgi:hypothetical protein